MLRDRSGRERRHEQILDELAGLEPPDRPRRLAEAVAAGDILSDEADQALRIMSRLDAMRTMTIPSMAAIAQAKPAEPRQFEMPQLELQPSIDWLRPDPE